MYRARLIGWDYSPRSRIFKGTVRFLDSGRSQKVQMCDLFLFKADIEQSQMPPRCFECRLAEIQPSTANISGGHAWDRRVIERFQQTVLNRRVKAEVIFNLAFFSVFFPKKRIFSYRISISIEFQLQFVSFTGLFSGEWCCKCYHSHRWYKSERIFDQRRRRRVLRRELFVKGNSRNWWNEKCCDFHELHSHYMHIFRSIVGNDKTFKIMWLLAILAFWAKAIAKDIFQFRLPSQSKSSKNKSMIEPCYWKGQEVRLNRKFIRYCHIMETERLSLMDIQWTAFISLQCNRCALQQLNIFICILIFIRIEITDNANAFSNFSGYVHKIHGCRAHKPTWCDQQRVHNPRDDCVAKHSRLWSIDGHDLLPFIGSQARPNQIALHFTSHWTRLQCRQILPVLCRTWHFVSIGFRVRA